MDSKLRKRMMAALLVALLAVPPAGPAEARRTHHGQHHVAADGGTYINSAGHRVHRPVRSSTAPAGATARCRDDSWSFSEHHRGTCSHHGGVARWL